MPATEVADAQRTFCGKVAEAIAHQFEKAVDLAELRLPLVAHSAALVADVEQAQKRLVPLQDVLLVPVVLKDGFAVYLHRVKQFSQFFAAEDGGRPALAPPHFALADGGKQVDLCVACEQVGQPFRPLKRQVFVQCFIVRAKFLGLEAVPPADAPQGQFGASVRRVARFGEDCFFELPFLRRKQDQVCEPAHSFCCFCHVSPPYFYSTGISVAALCGSRCVAYCPNVSPRRTGW